MKFLRRFYFAWIYAFLDIFPLSIFGANWRERLSTIYYSLKSCTTALLNIITMTILVVTISTVAGLYVGATEMMRHYIEENDMARTVQVSAVLGTRVKPIDAATLEEFAGLSTKKKLRAVRAAYGWNDDSQWFYDSLFSKEDELTMGRTIAPQDTLFDRLDIIWPKKNIRTIFTGYGMGQMVVSKQLLSDLGYKVDSPEAGLPTHLYINYMNRPAAVKVVAVCEQLPGVEHYLITQAFARAINDLQWVPVKRYDRAFVGPLPAGTNSAAVDRKLQEILAGDESKLIGAVKLWSGQEHIIVLQIPGAEGLDEQAWAKKVRLINLKLLGPEATGLKLSLGDPLPPPKAPRATLPSSYTRATVYVNNLEDVPAVVDRLNAMGFNVVNQAKEMAQIFNQISSFGQSVLMAVIFIVGLLTSISIFLSFTQRIKAKTHEIGILKAYGTGNAWVFFVYLIEAFIIWVFSMVLGIWVVTWTSNFVNQELVEIFTLQGTLGSADAGVSLVDVSWRLLSVVGVGSLALCWGATMLAGWVAVRMPPAQALKVEA